MMLITANVVQKKLGTGLRIEEVSIAIRSAPLLTMALKAYFNLPNATITIHRVHTCPEIKKHRKTDQRHIAITPARLRKVLSDFIQDRYDFRADAAHNDLWLDISLPKAKHAASIVYVVHLMLSGRYRRFSKAQVHEHC
jgi:hypothetical protein